jgi:hypothetical protein
VGCSSIGRFGTASTKMLRLLGFFDIGLPPYGET